MIVDTSAVLALLVTAPAAAAVDRAMRNAPVLRMAAPTWVELAATLADRDPTLRRRVDDLLVAYQVQIEPFTAEQALAARDALRDYGATTGHPARLNVGDAFSYALAALSGEPLLFVGQDLARTDVVAALS